MTIEFIEEFIEKSEGSNLYLEHLQTCYLTYCHMRNEEPVSFTYLQQLIENAMGLDGPVYNLLNMTARVSYPDIKLSLPEQDVSEFKRKYLKVKI